MRAALFETPRDPDAWLVWGWHHKDSHDRIRLAILGHGGPLLPDYPIYPISKQVVTDWLQYNAQLHADMNGALRLQGSDLLSVDLDNSAQRLAWIALHAKEHENAELALGI